MVNKLFLKLFHCYLDSFFCNCLFSNGLKKKRENNEIKETNETKESIEIKENTEGLENKEMKENSEKKEIDEIDEEKKEIFSENCKKTTKIVVGICLITPFLLWIAKKRK